MDKLHDESIARDGLLRNIIGEVVTSKNINTVLKKWRTIFKISQKDLAKELGITSSVISDYESGRRKNPGILMVKKYIEALLKIDEKSGGEVLRTFSKKIIPPLLSDAILDIREFASGVGVEDFCKIVGAEIVVGGTGMVYGYSVIDSIKAITEFSTTELVGVYGATTQRALIFTKVSTGKGPMVAIKLTNLKPSLVILHGISEVDEIAKRIAEVENIPLAVCRNVNLEKIINSLKSII